MRFQKGVRFSYFRRPRGRGRATYKMSRTAYHSRLHNLARVERPRTHAQTQRLQIEIALAAYRGESYRAMARRLGCSHVHCWRVARRYRTGQIPWLPSDEESLLSMWDRLGLGGDSHADTALAEPVRANMADRLAQLQLSNPYRVMAHARTLREWKDLERRGGRRVLFRVPVR
jgi:hypothetical protein